MSKEPKAQKNIAAQAVNSAVAQGKSPYSDYTPTQLRAHLRKAEGVVARQKNMAEAGLACERLLNTADFNTVLEHLRSTAARMTLDAPQRQNMEQRQQDQLIVQSIAVVLDMLETLPEVGESMAKNAVDTAKAVATIRALV